MPETVFVWSPTASSNANVDSGIGWAEGQLPGTVNNSARAMMAALAKLRDDQGGKLVTTGSSNAYVLTTASGVPALADGVRLTFIASFSNTGAATLNVDALGAKAIRKGADTALASGDIVQNAAYEVVYDASANSAAGAWLLPVGVLAVAPTVTFLALTDTPDDYTGDGGKILVVNSGATAVEFVTPADAAAYRANTSNRILDADGVWAAADPVTITFATTMAPDLSTGIDFKITATDNFTLNVPTNVKAGQKGIIKIAHSGAARTMTLGTGWRTPGGTQIALGSTIDILSFWAETDSIVYIFRAGLNMAAI